MLRLRARGFITLLPCLLMGTLVLTGGHASPAQARIAQADTKQVPLARLIANLEASVRKHPNQLYVRVNLARAYTMAYAQNSDTAPLTVRVSNGAMEIHDDQTFEYRAHMQVPGKDQRSAAARTYLARASALYDVLLRDPALSAEPYLAPRVRLGHAWCHEQSGNKAAAMAGYRDLVSKVVPVALTPDVTDLVFTSDAAAEAAGYLLAMLDRARDAKEFALITQRLVAFGKIPRAITPVAIPLQPDTALADIEDRSARVTFDVDGRNVGQAWRWITPLAGWLVHDHTRSRRIDSGLRLFGSVSFGMFWENGYQAMALLDDNHDGQLDGAELDGLSVWVDQNRDGICDDAELKSLAQLRIAALRYSHLPLPGHPDRIMYAPQGVVYDDGTFGPSYDLLLHSVP